MACQYHRVKGNPEKMEKESKRIGAYLNDKYQKDEEFRNKKVLYQREYRLKKKLEKQVE
jgi:hypothetical protein